MLAGEKLVNNEIHVFSGSTHDMQSSVHASVFQNVHAVMVFCENNFSSTSNAFNLIKQFQKVSNATNKSKVTCFLMVNKSDLNKPSNGGSLMVDEVVSNHFSREFMISCQKPEMNSDSLNDIMKYLYNDIALSGVTFNPIPIVPPATVGATMASPQRVITPTIFATGAAIGGTGTIITNKPLVSKSDEMPDLEDEDDENDGPSDLCSSLVASINTTTPPSALRLEAGKTIINLIDKAIQSNAAAGQYRFNLITNNVGSEMALAIVEYYKRKGYNCVLSEKDKTIQLNW